MLNIQTSWWKTNQTKKPNQENLNEETNQYSLSTLNSGGYLARQGLALQGLLLNKLEIHPYLKKMMKTFFNFFVFKHNMSLVFQAGKKITAQPPNPAFQDEIMEILCFLEFLNRGA